MPFNLPGHVLVQARFGRGTIGDAIINTFAFATDDPIGPAMDDVKTRLDVFYGGLAGTQVATLASKLHNSITGVTYYGRMANAGVGVPGEERPGQVGIASPGGNSLPADVCAAISYRAALPNSARRRGRIYFGPLLVATIDPFGVLNASFRTDLAQAAKGLASASLTAPIQWVIASRAGNSAAAVARGYVDGSTDTQRRRDPVTEKFGRNADTWTV